MHACWQDVVLDVALSAAMLLLSKGAFKLHHPRVPLGVNTVMPVADNALKTVFGAGATWVAGCRVKSSMPSRVFSRVHHESYRLGTDRARPRTPSALRVALSVCVVPMYLLAGRVEE